MNQVNDNVIIEALKPHIMEIALEVFRTEMLNTNDITTVHIDSKIDLIPIKECTKLIPGISYYTVRELIQRGDIEYFRTGQGQHGKILVYKKSFLDYFANNGGII